MLGWVHTLLGTEHDATWLGFHETLRLRSDRSTDPHPPAADRRLFEAGSTTAAVTTPRSRLGVVSGLSRSTAVSLLAAVAVTLFVWMPFFRSDVVSDRYKDWTFRAEYASYAVRALFDEHEVPHWTTLPEYEQYRLKGNHGFFSNPETEVLSPYILLYRLFSFVPAFKISLAAHLLVGLLGVCLLCTRCLRLRDPAAIATVSLLMLSSGFYVAHLLIGHLQFVSYAYFPLVFFFYLRSLGIESLRGEGGPQAGGRLGALVGAALLLAGCVYEGNVHLLIHFWMFLAALSGLLVLSNREQRWRPITSFLSILVLFLLLSAYKLLPMYFEYGSYRADYVVRYDTASQLLAALVDRRFWKGPGFVHELGLYVGWVGAGLLAVGYLNLRRRTLPLIVCGALLLALCFAPYPEILNQLPLMKTQGAFTRFRGLFVFVSACLLALALRDASAWLAERKSRIPLVLFRVLVALLCLVVANDLRRSLSRFIRATSHEQVVMREARVVAPALSVVASELPQPTTAEPPPSVEIVETHVDAFSYVYRGPASPEHPVLLSAPAFNLTLMGDKLRLEGQGRLTEHQGSLAVQMTEPEARFTLRYGPWYAVCGLGLSLLTALLLLVYAARNLVWAPRAASRPRA